MSPTEAIIIWLGNDAKTCFIPNMTTISRSIVFRSHILPLRFCPFQREHGFGFNELMAVLILFRILIAQSELTYQYEK